jgi:hypothetical protein
MTRKTCWRENACNKMFVNDHWSGFLNLPWLVLFQSKFAKYLSLIPVSLLSFVGTIFELFASWRLYHIHLYTCIVSPNGSLIGATFDRMLWHVRSSHLLIIRDVPDLNLGLETGYPDRVFDVFRISCRQLQYSRLVRRFTHLGFAYSLLRLRCSTRDAVSARVFWSVAT